MTKSTRDLLHFLPLVVLFVLGLVGFLLFSFNPLYQVVITLAVAFAYVAWGIVHHLLLKDLEASIVVEYIIIAILGLVAILPLLFK